MTLNKIAIVLNQKFGKETPILANSVYSNILKISKKSFRKFVKNEAQPRLDELERIGKWLNVAPKDLF